MRKCINSKVVCALFLFWSATAILASAQAFTTLVDFNGNDGASPGYMSLAQGTDGNLYGTTEYGGNSRACPQSGCGVIFRTTPNGSVTSFALNSGLAEEPVAGLVLATDGNLYGVGYAGGSHNGGTVFKISKTGKVTVLYSFCAQSNCTDGESPSGTLVEGRDGNLYGTTERGGTHYCPSSGGCGTVFKITPKGQLTTLHNFCSVANCSDGSLPIAGVVMGTDGNFYGATYGTSNPSNWGTIFKITSAGTLTTLYAFDGVSTGLPAGTLVQGIDGDFYGTTHLGCGSVFRITHTGVFTPIYFFCSQSGCPDGCLLQSGVTQGTDGNFYGVTSESSTVFQLTTSGALTILHKFSGTSDGAGAVGAILQATNGKFYGTTSQGGSATCDLGFGCGTVFSVDTGLDPFIAFVVKTGKIGHTAEIVGQGFTGATSVLFNSIPANFTVQSDTFLTATVPAGASTGFVTVATPTATLTSNVPFQVLP